MSKLFQLSAMVTGVKTTPDQSLEVKIHTNDVATFEKDQLAELMSAIDKQYWIAFAEQPLRADDIDTKAERVEKGEKSPSQRLRAVLYVYWEQKGGDGDFESFYRSKMEGLIESIKGKLDQ